MFDAPWRSRAIAVHTQESIPPLKSTTALRESFIKSIVNYGASVSRPLLCEISASPRYLYLLPSFLRRSNALCRRIPDELVQLQAQPHRQAISQNPFHE